MSYQFQDLTRLFNPQSIAIVGASDRMNSIGGHALANIVEHSDFDGDLYLVNPKKDRIGERTCYPSIADLPAAVDVALVVIPAAGVIDALQQAGEKGIPFAIVLTSGFSEAGPEGQALEVQIKDIVAKTGIRVYGPNCPGLVNITHRLGLTFSPAFKNNLKSGPIGVATQGGGLGRNIIQSMDRGVGFALWSSSGNEVDLQVADFIHYMAGDENIKVIITLMEGIKDGPRFISAVAHAAKMGKPVVGLKVGHSEYGSKAAQSHTASITGSAEVNSEVFRQFGVIEASDLDEMVDIATLLVRKIPVGNEKVAVFASSGGATSLCADNVGTAGLTLADFSEQTTHTLADQLPEYAAIHNPVDTTSITVSNPDAFKNTLIPVANDPDVGLVFIPIAMDYGKFTENTARLILEAQKATDTPICPIWMSDQLGEGFRILCEGGITPFRSLRNMGVAGRRWIDYGKWRQSQNPDWTPLLLETGPRPETATKTLNEIEGKTELANAGIAVAQAQLAQSPQQAKEIAREINSPLAMKIVSPDILHKSDIGGVQLNIAPDNVSKAYQDILSSVKQAKPAADITGILLEPMAPPNGLEVFIGVSRDQVFGHMMTFGLGGIHVELFQDVTRRMLPVTRNMAHEMISELKTAPLLKGTRGQPKRDIEALAQLIASVSDYITQNATRLEQMDINPVWVGTEEQGAMALDAVIEVRA